MLEEIYNFISRPY